ncbi:MAG: cupin domain-containing protein [Burkholderiales bacterium]|jgi:putative transcriptional regulator|nr:cupin domain-containing protein [Burkholderiales bacterium]
MNQTIRHHPDDHLLLGLATGRLSTGTRLLVASHLETCGACRQEVARLEQLGGVLLDELPPAALDTQALARTLAAIDAPLAGARAAAAAAPIAAPSHPPMPDGAPWPEALAHCPATPWRWIGPGMRWSRVTVPEDPAANLFLLRIAAGKYLPQHTHSESELTQVLYGTFHDGRALFGPGDFDGADGSVRHQPVVQAGSECICLASVEGRVLFDGWFARMAGAVVGM